MTHTHITMLHIGASGHDFGFTDNPDFVKYIAELYPQFEVEASLSLTVYPQRNLHQLPVKLALREGLTFDSPEVHKALIDGVLDFLDRATEDMYKNGVTRAKVILSRIDAGTVVNPIAQQTEFYGHLRAVFQPI